MLKKNLLAISVVGLFSIILFCIETLAFEYKDPEGIYVPTDGVYMVHEDPNGPLINFVDITKNYDGTYDVWIGESYKGAPQDTVSSILPNIPFAVIDEYKDYVDALLVTYDGFDTLCVSDNYGNNQKIYYRINDDIRNHINFSF